MLLYIKYKLRHLPVFSNNVFGVFGLFIISINCVNTNGMYGFVSGPKTINLKKKIQNQSFN